VTQGPMQGQFGCYEGLVRADHHRVIMGILGHGVKTDIPGSMLEVAA